MAAKRKSRKLLSRRILAGEFPAASDLIPEIQKMEAEIKDQKEWQKLTVAVHARSMARHAIATAVGPQKLRARVDGYRAAKGLPPLPPLFYGEDML